MTSIDNDVFLSSDHKIRLLQAKALARSHVDRAARVPVRLNLGTILQSFDSDKFELKLEIVNLIDVGN